MTDRPTDRPTEVEQVKDEKIAFLREELLRVRRALCASQERAARFHVEVLDLRIALEQARDQLARHTG